MNELPPYWQTLWDSLSPDSDHPRETLTRLAKAIRKAENVKHSAALDLVAQRMGHPSWAALSAANREEPT